VSNQNEPKATSSTTFTREQRVDLFRLVTDLFPPPVPDGLGGESEGDELYALKDVLERALHWLPSSLGDGGIIAWVQKFIVTGSDEELLTLIQYMPTAQHFADEKKRSGRYNYGFHNLAG
jgi:hypothetical protein